MVGASDQAGPETGAFSLGQLKSSRSRVALCMTCMDMIEDV